MAIENAIETLAAAIEKLAEATAKQAAASQAQADVIASKFNTVTVKHAEGTPTKASEETPGETEKPEDKPKARRSRAKPKTEDKPEKTPAKVEQQDDLDLDGDDDDLGLGDDEPETPLTREDVREKLIEVKKSDADKGADKARAIIARYVPKGEPAIVGNIPEDKFKAVVVECEAALK